MSHGYWPVVTIALVVGWLSGGESAAREKGRGVEYLASVKLEIHDDIPYAQVQVNDSKPVWFIIDSGASGQLLDPALCKELRIPTEGKTKGTGAGAGTYDVTFAKDVTYTVDGLKF